MEFDRLLDRLLDRVRQTQSSNGGGYLDLSKVELTAE